MIFLKKHTGYFLLFLLLLPGMAISQEIPPPPNPPRLVVDYADLLPANQEAWLERKLVAFDDTTSTQIAVVLVNSLNGLTKEEFADRVGEKWGVGRKDKDNGIVVLVKPKTQRERGEARISVAYGLEDVIPDAVANRIVDNIMIPYFRENDYFGGLREGTDVIMGLAAGKFTAEEVQALNPGNSGFFGLLPILFFILIFILIRRNSRRYYHSGGRGTGLLTGLLLGSMLSHRGSRGSWSSFNSGSGSFGGGGGFGGFGGGSFGGGGAGGSW